MNGTKNRERILTWNRRKICQFPFAKIVHIIAHHHIPMDFAKVDAASRICRVVIL